ncbi:anti-sigma factor [Agrococcus jejuensis]|uniref:Regulator of SigK n=1 Tax=Agrococcus jejuensis TaxID=399736 RepID=A0A1G8GSL9_9MICO|nr:anti-sigma factor [Agrococcus jejuensis]SDH97359.1 Anti-sigma-K factor rskA [Agrococcus jejuensis]
MMKHREDIAARALDALETEERRRFDAEADEATLAELADMQQTAAALADAVAVAPPADLRARIFEQVAATEQLTAEETTPVLAAVESDDTVDAETLDDREPALVGGGSTVAGPRELAARRRWFQRPGSLLGAAAAAVVLLVGGIGIGQAIRTPDPVSALVHAADVRTQTASLADGSRATLMWSDEQGEAAFVFQGLSQLEAEQVYQAWFMPADGDPIPAGTFAGGDGSVVHALDGTLEEGDGVAITVEPEGGSEQPTTQPLLVMLT